MFVVTKGDEKKNRFVIHYEPQIIPEIKLEAVNKPQKKQSPPKIKEKEQPKKIEKNNIIIPPQIPHNLFRILHNQNQIIIPQPKLPSPHLKKKRFIDNDTGNTIGRWSRDEHKKFIEAIIKFGNNWKEVQEYVNSRTSTQARSHAQKFFEKIKKNNTLQFFESLDSDYSENFTNATIMQLHNKYGNKSKSEINNVVNKFLSLEYDLPKKRRKLMNNNINGITRKKNNNNKNNINEEYEENEFEEQEDNEAYKDNNNNNDENNNSNNNNFIDNHKYIEYNNAQEYLQKPRMIEDINKGDNSYFSDNYNNQNYLCGYGHDFTNYIISQFVHNLGGFDLEQNPIKINKRKNTLESFEDESYFQQTNNYGYVNQTNLNLKCNAKSRKNSIESVNKIIKTDKNDFKDFYKNILGLDEFNQNKSPFENNELKNPNIIFDDYDFKKD